MLPPQVFNIGVMYCCYFGIMEKKMETTILGLCKPFCGMHLQFNCLSRTTTLAMPARAGILKDTALAVTNHSKGSSLPLCRYGT